MREFIKVRLRGQEPWTKHNPESQSVQKRSHSEPQRQKEVRKATPYMTENGRKTDLKLNFSLLAVRRSV